MEILISQKNYKRLMRIKDQRGLKSIDETMNLLLDVTLGRTPKPGTLCKTCGNYDTCDIGRDASEFCGGYKKK